jgi:hypothetical protein
MSLNEIKSDFQIPGKGEIAILEIFNPVKHTRKAVDVIRVHVPENRGARAACSFAFLGLASHRCNRLLYMIDLPN